MKFKQNNNSTLFLFISVLFCSCLLISNTCAFKLIKIGPFSITSGVLIFPITYIINDLVSEVYGYKKAKNLIWFGFIMNCLMVLYYQLAISLPYPEYFTGQLAFSTVLGGTWRILLASFLAYIIGSFSNATIMSKLKVYHNGNRLMYRAIVSTFIGELLDSIFFVGIAFSFVYDFGTILDMIVIQTLLKTLYEIVIFPVTKLVINKVKNYEEIDIFDTDIKSYNPLKINKNS